MPLLRATAALHAPVDSTTPLRALPSVLLRALATASGQGRPARGGQLIFVLQFTPCAGGVYVWLESRAEITNVSYRMDSAIAADRHSAAAERVGSSSVLVAKVSEPKLEIPKINDK